MSNCFINATNVFLINKTNLSDDNDGSNTNGGPSLTYIWKLMIQSNLSSWDMDCHCVYNIVKPVTRGYRDTQKVSLHDRCPLIIGHFNVKVQITCNLDITTGVRTLVTDLIVHVFMYTMIIVIVYMNTLMCMYVNHCPPPPPNHPHIWGTKSEQGNRGYNGYRFQLSLSTIWRNHLPFNQ